MMTYPDQRTRTDCAGRVAARPSLPHRITCIGDGLRAVFLASALCAAPCTAVGAVNQDLDSYDALLGALTSGQRVSTLLDLARCKRDGSDAPGPNVRGGAQISRFIIPNGQYVAFADTHLTLDTEDRPVTEYIRYRAMPDGSVSVRFATLAAGSNEVTLRGKYRCHFNHGIRFIKGDAPGSSPSGTGAATPAETAVQKSDTDARNTGTGSNLDQ